MLKDLMEPIPLSIFLYGGLGSGKTRFAATFPKTLFITSAMERGRQTLQAMDHSLFHNSEQPAIWEIGSNSDLSKIAEMMAGINHAIKYRFKTVVIDAFTIYCSEVLRLRSDAGDDNYQMYGFLLRHTQNIVSTIASGGLNIIFNAWEDPGDKDKGKSPGPAVPGKSVVNVPGTCSIVARIVKDKGKHVLRLSPKGGWVCRHRFPKLPDEIENPTYEKLLDAITTSKKKKGK